jgi:CRP-like cAMP-binding protein
MNASNLFKHDTDTTNQLLGDVLFSQGEPGDCMYVLLEGAVDIIVNTSPFPALRSGQWLFQRSSPQKQILGSHSFI